MVTNISRCGRFGNKKVAKQAPAVWVGSKVYEKFPQNHLVVWIKIPTFALEINNKTITT